MKKSMMFILVLGIIGLTGCAQGAKGPVGPSRTPAAPQAAGQAGKPSGAQGAAPPSAPASAAPSTPVPAQLAPAPPSKPAPAQPAPAHSVPAQAIAFNPISFTAVSYNQAPPAVQSLVDSMKEQAGTQTAVVDGETYAVITAGEKPSGGYQVLVSQVSDAEGKVQVLYAIKKPEGAAIAVITYPFAIVKFQGHGLPVTFQGSV